MALSYCHALALFQLTAARRRLVGLPMSLSIMFDVSTHSRPKAAGILLIVVIAILKAFQLTAARRRLGTNSVAVKSPPIVSTHSRPKAAGPFSRLLKPLMAFQLTAARRRLESGCCLF